MNILYSEKEIITEVKTLLPFFLILIAPIILFGMGIIQAVLFIAVLGGITYGTYSRTVKITDHSLVFGNKIFKSRVDFSDIKSVEIKELPETVSFGLVDVYTFGPKRKLNNITMSTVIARESKKSLIYITTKDATDFSQRLKDAMSKQ